MPKRLLAKIKHHFVEVAKIRKSPHSIALGFSVGTFISIALPPGLHLVPAILAILIYEKLSKLSLIASIFFWNPFTLAPVYILSYQIGDFILGGVPIPDYTLTFWQQIFYFSRRFMAGGLVVASVTSVVSYFLIKAMAHYYGVRRILKESE